jgi:hypothetical protein
MSSLGSSANQTASLENRGQAFFDTLNDVHNSCIQAEISSCNHDTGERCSAASTHRPTSLDSIAENDVDSGDQGYCYVEDKSFEDIDINPNTFERQLLLHLDRQDKDKKKIKRNSTKKGKKYSKHTHSTARGELRDNGTNADKHDAHQQLFEAVTSMYRSYFPHICTHLITGRSSFSSFCIHY